MQYLFIKLRCVIGALLVSYSSILFAMNAPQARQEIKVSTTEYIAHHYKALTKDTPCHKYELPKKHVIPRGAIELLLMCRALELGGLSAKIRVVASPTYTRSLRMVESGSVHIAAESIWRADIDEKVLLFSEPIIADGVFEKGLYAKADHPMFSTPLQDIDVKNLRGITVKGWHADRKALEEITPTVYNAQQHSYIIGMLRLGRADFTLNQFTPNDDLTVEYDGLVMKPIPNIKVTLSGSRHYVISKRSALSLKVFEALNKGIETLRDSGGLDRYLREMAAYNLKTKDWKVLNLKRKPH